MKKYLIFLLAAAMTLSMTACGGNGGASSGGGSGSTGNAGSESAESPAGLDLEGIYRAIVASQPEELQGDITMLLETDEEIIDGLYPGLSDVELTQEVLYVAPVTGWACEVALVETADSSGADAVQEIFQSRIDTGRNETYYPETAAGWMNAQIQTQGNYVCMIVLPDGCTIPDNVFSLSPLSGTDAAEDANSSAAG